MRLKRRVVERGTVDGAEDGLLLFRQRARRAGKKCRGKKFDVGKIVGLDDFTAQPGAAVGDGPAGLIGFVIKFTVKRDGLELHFPSVLPYQCPTVAAGDAFALMVGLRRPMNLRSRRNNQPAPKINVSVMRPMMGVWMEDESTVTTVSQGISRPNGANTALNFLVGRFPAELSATD